jgi:hypothetical protein
VFFLTAAQLVPQDTDTAFDIYDARICTPASPCLTPPVPTPAGCTEANACRPSEPAQQAPLAPTGSATVSGQGNGPSGTPHPGGSLGSKTTKSKPATRAERLAKALTACRRTKSKHNRARCEAQARKKWGAKGKHTSASRRTSRGRR